MTVVLYPTQYFIAKENETLVPSGMTVASARKLQCMPNILMCSPVDVVCQEMTTWWQRLCF